MKTAHITASVSANLISGHSLLPPALLLRLLSGALSGLLPVFDTVFVVGTLCVCMCECGGLFVSECGPAVN